MKWWVPGSWSLPLRMLRKAKQRVKDWLLQPDWRVSTLSNPGKICKIRTMSDSFKQLALLHRDRKMNKNSLGLKLYGKCEMVFLPLICPTAQHPMIKWVTLHFPEKLGTYLLMLLLKVLCELKRALTKGEVYSSTLALKYCYQVCAYAYFISVKPHHNAVREVSSDSNFHMGPQRGFITCVSELELWGILTPISCSTPPCFLIHYEIHWLIFASILQITPMFSWIVFPRGNAGARWTLFPGNKRPPSWSVGTKAITPL